MRVVNAPFYIFRRIGDELYYPLILHWDGTSWSNSANPEPSGMELHGASGSGNDVWAVGNTAGGFGVTLTMHWDGSAWSVVPSPNVGPVANNLRAVSGSGGNVWAAGVFVTDVWDNTMTMHCTDQCGSVTPSPTLPATGISTPTRTATRTAVSTQTSTAIPAGSQTPIEATSTPSPTDSVTPVAGTATPLPTGTSLPATATVAATATTAPASPTPTTCSLSFSDVPLGSAFCPYVHCLACLGIINGYSDGTFRPNNNVTRGQLSKIVDNSAGFSDPQPSEIFQDGPVGSTFYDYIERLASRSVIPGYVCGGAGEPCVSPGNLPYFRPNNKATRGQTSKIVANTFFAGCDRRSR